MRTLTMKCGVLIGSRVKGRILKWLAGFGAVLACLMVYLLMTGERDLSLSSSSQPTRAIEITRMHAADTEDSGWSPRGLDAVFDYASTLSADALIIVTKGETVGALGDLKTSTRTHSMRKVFLSALVGQHFGSGARQIPLDATLEELDIDDAPKPLSDLQRQATVMDLLRSKSGISHPAAADGGLNKERDRVLGTGENQPGTIWAYNNWDYNTLTTIFEKRTGMTIAEAFETGIAKPTGMKDFETSDVTYDAAPERSLHKAAAFRMSARDLALFGQLYLNKGRMDDKQIIPASWVERITEDFTETGRSDLRWGHGYLWWIPDPELDLPIGTFWAWGLGNQAVVVVPAWDTVIVHQSDTTEFLNRFIPMIKNGQEGEVALEELILSCIKRENRKSEFCIEHRFTSRREFGKLISLIVNARS